MIRSINTRTATTTYRTETASRLLAELATDRHAPYTDAEEKVAFANVMANREEIINRNLRFVFSVAKAYAKGDDVCDYFSAGCIGLANAVERFDPSKGFRFISFAVHYIRMEMSLLAKGSDMVTASNHNIIGSKVKTYEARYFAEHGYYPSDAQIIEHLQAKHGITIKYATELHGTTMTALDAKVSDDADDNISEVGELAERTASTNDIEGKIEADNRKAVLNTLLNCQAISVTEQEVVTLLFLRGWTKERVARKLGFKSTERVRQISATALAKLRGYAERHKLAL